MVAAGMFIVIVPLLVFYAVGYRFDFSSTEQNIRTVGGMYVSTDAEGVQIYVDDMPVEDMRVFQRAAYVQNVNEGMRRVHVQGSGLSTWVKDLPVFAHYVTEVRSFNLPITPQLRVITPWQTVIGESVLFESVASTTFASASTSNLFFVATNTATSSYNVNNEYSYILTQFASSSEEAQQREMYRLHRAEPFLFAADIPTLGSTTVATTTKYARDRVLYEEEDELYVRYMGNPSNIPYYFCVQSTDLVQISELYGAHVAQSFASLQAATSTLRTFMSGQQWCRDTIKVDRQWQTVEWFDFHPELPDVVLIKSDDGLYGVEIDDRSWQNRQLLYDGTDFAVLVEGNEIYLRDGDYIMQILSQLIE